MERLTTRLSDGNYIPKALCTIARDGEVDDVDGCNECCDSCNGECSVCAIQKCFNKLAEYEDAEELKAQRQNPHGYSKEDIELNRKAAYNKAIDDFVAMCREKYQTKRIGRNMW